VSNEAPFGSPFQPAVPSGGPGVPAKGTPGRRPAAKGKAPAAAAPKRPGRKPRDPNAPPRAPKPVKLELATVIDVLAGVKSTDKDLLLQMVDALQKVPKASARRIAGTLHKIFAEDDGEDETEAS
jgi:hypothetical protein